MRRGLQEEHYGLAETSTKLLLSLCAPQETASGEQNKDKYIVITQSYKQTRFRTYLQTKEKQNSIVNYKLQNNDCVTVVPSFFYKSKVSKVLVCSSKKQDGQMEEHRSVREILCNQVISCKQVFLYP